MVSDKQIEAAVEALFSSGLTFQSSPDCYRAAARAALTAAAEVKTDDWVKVTDDIDHKTLKSINIDNQVIAYEKGRYFNAWLEFDEYEGGWIWRDEADSEPSPSHYRALLSPPALTTECE